MKYLSVVLLVLGLMLSACQESKYKGLSPITAFDAYEVKSNKQNNANDKQLLVAVIYEEFAKAKQALEAGADPNTKDTDGTVVLWHAVKNRDVEMVELLLKHKANPNPNLDHKHFNEIGKIENNLLFMCVTGKIVENGVRLDDQEAQLEIFKLLLQYGANPAAIQARLPKDFEYLDRKIIHKTSYFWSLFGKLVAHNKREFIDAIIGNEKAFKKLNLNYSNYVKDQIMTVLDIVNVHLKNLDKLLKTAKEKKRVKEQEEIKQWLSYYEDLKNYLKGQGALTLSELALKIVP